MTAGLRAMIAGFHDLSDSAMAIETAPIQRLLKDLEQRLESLRGYL